MLFSSIFFKIGAAIITVEIIVLAVAGKFYSGRFHRQIDIQVRERAELPGHLISTGLLNIASVTDKEIMEHLVGEELAELEDGLIIGVNGIIFQSLNPVNLGKSIDEVEGIGLKRRDLGNHEINLEQTSSGNKYLITLTPLYTAQQKNPFLYAYIKVNINAAEHKKREISRFFSFGSLIVIAVSSLVIILIIQWSFRIRIDSIVSVLRKIAHGDFSARIIQNIQNDEIGLIQANINSMAIDLDRFAKNLNDRYAELMKAKNEIHKLNAELEMRVRQRTADLEETNKELEAFTYSVSHDLRAPLRSIDGFSLALLEDYTAKLDETGVDYLQRVRKATQRMGVLIDALLKLSRQTRGAIEVEKTDLSMIVRNILNLYLEKNPDRKVDATIQDQVICEADPRLMEIVIDNLLGNAWKFTRNEPVTKIDFGTTQLNGHTVYYLKDNGVGFDMQYSEKLFAEFQRLHPNEEFEGTGIGLATVRRIITRHHGKIWAESKPGEGAVFYFHL